MNKDAIVSLLAREENKLQRQKDNLDATEVEKQVLGDSARVNGKIERQRASISVTEHNINVLQKHLKKLD